MYHALMYSEAEGNKKRVSHMVKMNSVIRYKVYIQLNELHIKQMYETLIFWFQRWKLPMYFNYSYFSKSKQNHKY